MVLVSIVITAMLFATDDVTVADPSPELSCVNLEESCSCIELNFREVISPFAVLTVKARWSCSVPKSCGKWTYL